MKKILLLSLGFLSALTQSSYQVTFQDIHIAFVNNDKDNNNVLDKQELISQFSDLYQFLKMKYQVSSEQYNEIVERRVDQGLFSYGSDNPGVLTESQFTNLMMDQYESYKLIQNEKLLFGFEKCFHQDCPTYQDLQQEYEQQTI